MTELVHYHVRNGVATITLDSQHNRNALSARLMGELAGLLSRAATDEAVRVVVLTHAGRVFCSGMDLKASQGDDAAAMPVTAFPDILRTIWEFDKPMVARVAGPARAGGVGLIGACDIAVAARSATFAFTEVRLGVIPAVISVTVLPRLTPRAAHELFLTGEVFDGERAARVGLVNSAVDADELDAEVARYVDMLVLGAPTALAATKAMLRRAPAGSMAEDFEAMTALSARHFAGEEGQEGIAAFVQKRPPRWVPGAANT
ncbi:MAG TPA: enoyl-CoA hydratase family protein [Mycobacteriales bacterium]